MRVLLLALFAAGLAAQQLPPLPKVYPGPEQPLPFSHKNHAERQIECKTCHPTPDPGDFAEIVGLDVCMSCHRAVGSEKEIIAKMDEMERSNADLWWQPVYLIPDYVYFNHRKHAEAGAECVDCHGDVTTQDVLAKTRDTSMASCMSCHRETGASVECDFCHEPRGAAF